MVAQSRLQDLPPEGGYKPFNYKRVPLKPFLSTKLMIGGFLFISASAFYVYFLTDKEFLRDSVEMRSSRNVIMPVLIAERDRAYLKQLRRNRDDEAELMKNVPGWEVGTWYGEPIYKTRPRTTWIDPIMAEFYGQTADKYFFKRAHMALWE